MHRLRRFLPAFIALSVPAVLFATAPASAQTWRVTESQGSGTSASVCPQGVEGSDDFLCFRLECTPLEPIHFTIDLAGRGTLTAPVEVGLGVDGGEAGVMSFVPHEADGHTHLTAPFNPLLHESMVDLLQRGRRASLSLNLPGGVEEVPMGLTLSADSLLTAMRDCPKPVPPVGDAASLVLEEISRDCRDLGGTVTVEPGFERREDLDGDGREDVVIDYAAAVCSASATLNCTSGGCKVGFFLARGEGYKRFFAEVIRGYEVFSGGFLALDMDGAACGLYGFEACRKVFDIAGDAPVLAEEMAGPGAETVAIGGDAGPETGPETGAETGADPGAAEAVSGPPAETAEAAVAGEAAPVVVAVTEGVTITPEGPVEEVVEATVETTVVTTGGTAAETPAVNEPVSEAVAETPAEAEVPATATQTGEPAAPEAGEPAAAEAGAPAGPGASSAEEMPAPDTAAPAEAAPAEAAPETETATAPDTTGPGAPAFPVSAAPVPEPPVPAAAMQAGEGPTSRHMAGPAPVLPEGARFRGDGTLIRPEDDAQ
ncbi:MAG: hypothetical protein CSA74_04175 [Rhodobacterales bacterium]|nr:MAG: hypothetical protein CSA74_04175 [Rhodobacterales bacterium]